MANTKQFFAVIPDLMARSSVVFSIRGMALLLLCLSGCSALRPIEGVPASELPMHYRLPSRSVKSMIDLSLLRQTPPKNHRVDAGDILSIYIKGFLGGPQNQLPMNVRQNANSRSSLGYPIHVREDGSISLPQISPLSVRGMTMNQVEQAIRNAYTTGAKAPLIPGKESVLVSLQRPRHSRILVMRQEAGGRGTVAGSVGQMGNQFTQNSDKRGTGRVVSLPAYRNDVLHALAETGGLPGLDAENVIYVIRRKSQPANAIFQQQSPLKLQAPPAPALPPLPVRKNFPSNKTGGPSLRKSSNTSVIPLWELSRNRPLSRRNHSTIIRGQSPGPLLFAPLGGHTTRSRNVPRSRKRLSAPTHSAEKVSNTVLPVSRFLSKTIRPIREPLSPAAWPMSSTHIPTISNMAAQGARIIRIPLRLIPGETPDINEEDITLQDGDIVLIESRETDIFFTGGLLGGGRFTLPRDQDLDVLQALAIVQSQSNSQNNSTRAVGGVTAMNQDVTVGASELIVLRKLADGRQVAIKVDLYKAVRNPDERIYILPGDYLILQYTRVEAVGAFFERHFFEGLVYGGSSRLFLGQ